MMRPDDVAFIIMWAVLGFAALAICVDVLVCKWRERRARGQRIMLAPETTALFKE